MFMSTEVAYRSKRSSPQSLVNLVNWPFVNLVNWPGVPVAGWFLVLDPDPSRS